MKQIPILTPKDIDQPAKSKVKFWGTSITGPSRSPKNFSLFSSAPLPQLPINSGNFNSSEFDEVSDSEDEAKKQLEDEIERLETKAENQRELNQNLIKELNTSNNQIRVLSALNEELIAQKEKLYTEMIKSHQKMSAIQQQKLSFLSTIGELNQAKDFSANRIQILENQIDSANKKIAQMMEDVNLQKQANAEMKKEITVLRLELNNKHMNSIQHQNELQEQMMKVEEISLKFDKTKGELAEAKLKNEQLEKNEKRLLEDQNKFQARVQELQNAKKILESQLKTVEESFRLKSEEFQNIYEKQGAYNQRYSKILGEMQYRIDNLIFEVLALEKRNKELLDEKDFYMRRSQNANVTSMLPYEQFIYILNESNGKIEELKRKIQFKDDEFTLLQQKYNEEISNARQRIQELQSIIRIREIQERNLKEHYTSQSDSLQKECEILLKKNEEIKNSQMKMRLQIGERDRIILEYVNNQKRSVNTAA